MVDVEGLKKWMQEHKVSVVDLDWEMLKKHNISMAKLLRWELRPIRKAKEVRDGK